jgi:preprotein translocase subunit YajC
MNNFALIIFVAVFYFLFWGPHTKPKEKKDDKKGGDKKGGAK